MRILIADRDPAFIKNLREYLQVNGDQVIAEAEDGITALKLFRTMQPDIVILEATLPGMDGLEVSQIIEESKLAPVIMITNYADINLLHSSQDWPFPVLPKPVDMAALTALMDYVTKSHKKVMALEKEIDKLQNDLVTRKLVEKAKGILMRTKGISEPEAFRRLQQLSMKKRLPMKKLAEAIILAEES